ncbi:glycosyltransferase family 4 protein [Candidatus Parcubacteria bacterium]|nr:glycosyltransferase family 4 protein [Candidatus Parcubacteria bacterium]
MKIAININELTLKQETGVKVYTRGIVNALGKIDKENEYILYASNRVSTNANFKLKTIKSQFPFWTYTKLPQEIKKDKPDVLFMPIQSVPFFKKPKNIKIVITVHDLAFMIFPDHFTVKDRFLLKFHTKRAVQMADAIIAPSEATKKDIIKFYNINENKIKVVYHGVNQNFSEDKKESDSEASESDSFLSLDSNNPYILFVGQIQPRKNLIRLIEAFETIKSRRNEKSSSLKLIIAGGKGWMADKTYEKAKKSKFSEDIIFLGKVSGEDLVKLYQNALMFVLPSLYEGFGLPVLEAMSYGVPCIVSDNSSLSEIVDDHALLVNAKSSDDIAQKINMFLNNDFLRKDFAQRSLKNIKEFSWDKSAKETLEVFESV